MNLENVSKKALAKKITKMYNLMFRVAGELYVVNPGSKIFHDGTFDRQNMRKISEVATFLLKKASDFKPEIKIDGKKD